MKPMISRKSGKNTPFLKSSQGNIAVLDRPYSATAGSGRPRLSATSMART